MKHYVHRIKYTNTISVGRRVERVGPVVGEMTICHTIRGKKKKGKYNGETRAAAEVTTH